MTNDPGDRHVLATAVRCHADLIVTYNRRHFPPTAVNRWEVEVQGPEQTAAVGLPLSRLLHSLARNIPQFVEYFCEEQGVEAP